LPEQVAERIASAADPEQATEPVGTAYHLLERPDDQGSVRE